jgi:hypothetical protein
MTESTLFSMRALLLHMLILLLVVLDVPREAPDAFFALFLD